jgi:hypothetical protein
MSDLRSQFLRSQFQFRSQLWGKLIPFIEVLRENNIANIEPIPDMTDEEVEAKRAKLGRHYRRPPPQPDDEVKVLVTLNNKQSNEFDNGHNKLFLWNDSSLLGYHYKADGSHSNYKLIYKIINDELKLNGLKIIHIARYHSSPTTTISILMKKTDIAGKQKQSRKRRKSTKQKNYIKKKNYITKKNYTKKRR